MERRIAIGEIIEISKQLEKELKRLKAEGKGLHELTNSIAEKLPETLVKRLHMLASMRNKAIHEAEHDVLAEFKTYKTTSDEVLTALSRIKCPRRKRTTANSQTVKSKSSKNSKAQSSNILFYLPFIPGLNLIYFIFMLVLGVMPAAFYFILLVASLASLIVGIHSLIEKKRQLAVTCGVIYLAGYIAGMFVPTSNGPKHIRMIRFAPVFNTAFFLRQSLFKVDWKLTACGILLTLATCTGFFALFQKGWQQTGAVLLGVSYFAGIIHFIFVSKKSPASNTGRKKA